MSYPIHEDVVTEEWKLLTSMDSIVRRIEMLSGSPRNLFCGKTWQSRLSAAMPLFLVVQAIYHILVSNLLGVFLSAKYSTEDRSLIFIEHSVNIMLHCFLVIRIMTFYLQSSGIHALAEDLKKVHRAEKFDGEIVKSLLQNAQKQANRLHRMLKMAFEVSSIIIVVSFTSESISAGTIYIRGWYPLDVESSPGFEITLLIMGLYALMLPIIVGQVDTLIVCFLYNMASQFYMLCYKLEHIREQAVRNVAAKYKQINRSTTMVESVVQLVEATRENADFIANEPSSGESVRGKCHTECDLRDRQLKYNADVDAEMIHLLGGLVGHHVALVRLTRQFEKIFNPLLCCQIATNLFLTSLCVFLILKEGHLSNRLVLLLSMTVLLVSEKLVFCYLADNISTQSSRVRDCAFGCAWLRSSARFNKSLRVAMSVANRELRVRVAGHVPLNMETFAQITKFSWSMVTLAKSLTEPARTHV